MGETDDVDPGVQTVLAISVTMVVAGLFQWVKSLVPNMPIPFTVFMFLFGMAMGGLTHAVDGMADYIAIPKISPETIFNVFLPLLIFEGAAALKRSVLKHVVWQAIVLAGPGLLLNTLFLALFFKYVFYTEWTWYSAVLLGATLSATDPVAVVALLRDLDADVAVTTITDGEAMMNDGTAIILFSLFQEAAATNEFMSAGEVVWRAILLLTGGGIFGYIVAQAILVVLRRSNNPIVETMLLVGGSYVCFYIAEHVILTSAVIAVMTVGIVIGGSEGTRPWPTSHMPNEMWEGLSFIANAIIFALAGLIVSIDAIPSAQGRDWWILVVLYLVLVVARAAQMGILMPIISLLTKREEYRITWQRFVLLVYGALRGGVGLALALIIYREDRIPENVRNPSIFLTAGCVVFSIVLNGSTAVKIVEWLNLAEKPPHKKFASKQVERFVYNTLQESIRHVLTNNQSGVNVEVLKALTLSHFQEQQHLDLIEYKDEVVIKPLVVRSFRTELWALREAEMVGPEVFGVLMPLCEDAVDSGEFLSVQKVLRASLKAFHHPCTLCYDTLFCFGRGEEVHTGRYLPEGCSPVGPDERSPGSSPSSSTPTSSSSQSFTSPTSAGIVIEDNDMARQDEVWHDQETAQNSDAFVCETLLTYVALVNAAHESLLAFSSKHRDIEAYARVIDEYRHRAFQSYELYRKSHTFVASAVATKMAVQLCVQAAKKKLHMLHHEKGLSRSLYTKNMAQLNAIASSTSELDFRKIPQPTNRGIFGSSYVLRGLTEDEKDELFEAAAIGVVAKKKKIDLHGVAIVLNGKIAKKEIPIPFYYHSGDYLGIRAVLQQMEYEEYYTVAESTLAVIPEWFLADFCPRNERFLNNLWSIAGMRICVEQLSKYYPYCNMPPEDVRHVASQGKVFFTTKVTEITITPSSTCILLQGSDVTNRYCSTSTALLPAPIIIELEPRSVVYIVKGISIPTPPFPTRCVIPFIDEDNRLMNRIIATHEALLRDEVNSMAKTMPLLMRYCGSTIAGTHRILTDSAAGVLPPSLVADVLAEQRDFCLTVQSWMAQELIGTFSAKHAGDVLRRWHKHTEQRNSWITMLLDHPDTTEATRKLLTNIHRVDDIISDRGEALLGKA